MRYITMFLLSLLLLAACAVPPPGPGQGQIQAVAFTETSGSVGPIYWRKQELTVKRNLTTSYVVRNYQGTVLERRTGFISRVQFNNLTAALRAARFRQVTSINKPQPGPIGGGLLSLVVQTPNKRFEFEDNAAKAFPPGIASVFNTRYQYKPR